ncbi:ciliary-associated calcium-binding coiled-coil protein 1 isoform X3 [Phasianus colchicus]|uniref:ciliary-associated calcium-binding coiled-coil protein 1 isoform X3 n=1 Tax=Phasianus colchicus TaxID=9054 RepID=UPI00129DB8DF|nr:ciliary-associated calcium-binding coiled-coil protein 1 isoform X3 [Phasianus colchicus]
MELCIWVKCRYSELLLLLQVCKPHRTDRTAPVQFHLLVLHIQKDKAGQRGETKDTEEEDQDQDAVGGQKTINHTFLSFSQITALSEQNVEGFQKKLAEFLNFKQLKTSLKEAILLDYYTAGFCWAKEMNFNLMQLSQYMDLLNFLLENLSDKHMTLEDNIKELGRAMAGIGETDSERSGDLDVFSIDQAKAIIDYMNISIWLNLPHLQLPPSLLHLRKVHLLICMHHSQHHQ